MIPFELVVFVAGLLIGSFLNVCIYRIPRGESIVFPSSRCPSCGAPISFYDNIPVVSYLILRGRCRYCKRKISFRYPLVELLNGMSYLAVLWRFGYGWPSVVYSVLVSALIVVTFVDLDFQIIPNRITLPGIPLGLIAGALLLPDPFFRMAPLGWRASLIGAVGGYAFYLLIAKLSLAILKKEGMGGGDVKFMAMVGAFLGWKAVVLTTFLGSLSGSAAGIALMIARRSRESMQIPFGPFLAFGTAVSLFFGQEIITWYLF